MSTTRDFNFLTPAKRPLPHRASQASVGRPALAALWQALRRWQLYRKTRRQLQMLDDRMLKDIGVSRSEIQNLSRRASRTTTT